MKYQYWIMFDGDSAPSRVSVETMAEFLSVLDRLMQTRNKPVEWMIRAY